MSSDGSVLASGSFDGAVTVWETSSQRRLATLLGHTGTVRGVALSADGHLLASGHRVASAGEDGTVRVWDGFGMRPPGVGCALDAPIAATSVWTSPAWGITGAQRSALLALGAIDHSE